MNFYATVDLIQGERVLYTISRDNFFYPSYCVALAVNDLHKQLSMIDARILFFEGEWETCVEKMRTEFTKRN